MTKHYLLLAAFLTIGLSASAQNKPAAPQIGVVQEMDQASVLQPMGYKYLLESTRRILSPRNVTDQQFEALLPTIKAMSVPMYGCNLFIPGDLKVVGPEVDEQAVLAYVEPVLQRAQKAGLTLITWGSGGSRSVPEGFSRLTATAQFIYMAKRVAEVAAKYDMILALENLNSTECNFITTLGEALAVVKAVDHPNLRLCVDVYHMLKENEPASAIAGSKGYAVYCEVAEQKRVLPRVCRVMTSLLILRR